MAKMTNFVIFCTTVKERKEKKNLQLISLINRDAKTLDKMLANWVKMHLKGLKNKKVMEFWQFWPTDTYFYQGSTRKRNPQAQDREYYPVWWCCTDLREYHRWSSHTAPSNRKHSGAQLSPGQVWLRDTQLQTPFLKDKCSDHKGDTHLQDRRAKGKQEGWTEEYRVLVRNDSGAPESYMLLWGFTGCSQSQFSPSES